MQILTRIDNPLELCDLKFASGKTGVFEGYASTFGNVDSFGDTILKGAFSDTLEERKRPVRMFFGHSPGRVIGKWTMLKEDRIGLRVNGELTPGHSDAENVYASLKHGTLDGLSIGFRIPTGGAEDTDSGGRLISKVDLIEISVVSLPAEDEARISSVKSITDEINSIQTIRDAETFLRDAGSFPRSMAKALISQLRAVYLREAETETERKEAMARDLEWLHKLTEPA